MKRILAALLVVMMLSGGLGVFAAAEVVPQDTTYTVTFFKNAGTDTVTNMPDPVKKVDGIILTLPTKAPVREGHKFLGWARSASGDVAFQPTDEYTEDAALDLYAKWEANKYPVTYLPNGDNVSNMPANQEKTHGTALTLSGTQPTRPSFVFQGWATSQSGAAAYQPGGTYNGNADLTLYAVWQANYKVTYYPNPPKNGTVTNMPANQEKVPGQGMQLSSTAPKCSGYEFLGWATSPSGGVAYAPGAPYSVDANLDLYAVWSNVTVWVRFEKNTVVLVKNMPKEKEEYKGSNVLVPREAQAPTRTGYNFMGWATKKGGKPADAVYQSGDTIYSLTTDITLYATWEKKEKPPATWLQYSPIWFIWILLKAIIWLMFGGWYWMGPLF